LRASALEQWILRLLRVQAKNHRLIYARAKKRDLASYTYWMRITNQGKQQQQQS
jgi:uncharacterized HAD superfamily protein